MILKFKNKYLILISLVIFTLTSCTTSKLEKYKFSFFDAFDTITTGVVYAKNENEAKRYEDFIKSRFMELNNYYDKYNDYEGVNNIKTINDNAGKEAVKVSKEIIDLLKFSIEKYNILSKETNIAMGSVLKIWHDYREGHEEGADFLNEDNHNHGEDHSEKEGAQIPKLEELNEAAKHTNIEDIVIDENAQTVFLKDPNMSLDVGAVAKGYATELVCKELEKMGVESALISSGGNVRIIGSPPESERNKFAVGLQNPDVLLDTGTGENIIDVAYLNNSSVVTSGDYQRYYVVDGKRYHHLIDKDTLMPGDYFRAVSVIVPDSGVADFLSTALFLMPYEEGLKLIDKVEDGYAYWIFKDGSIKYSQGMENILKSSGATDQ